MTKHQHPVLVGDVRGSGAMALAIVVMVLVFLYLVRSILFPFVFAGIVAYVCTPLVDGLARRTHWPRWIFAVATLIVLLAIAALLGVLGAPPLIREFARVASDLEGTLATLTRQLLGQGHVTLLGQSVDAGAAAGYLVQNIRDWLGESGRVATLLGLGFAGVFGFILTVVLLGYLLIGGAGLAEGLFWLVPPRARPFVHRVWDDLDPILRRYFIGVALVVLYASIVAYIGLGLILGLRHAVFLALITGILEIVPIVGPAASAVLAGLVAVQEARSAWNIIAYVAYATVLRISIDEFFGPIVLGKAAYVRPVLVMFCFLAGAVLFGIVGVILAIPVALTIKATLAELYREPEALTE